MATAKRERGLESFKKRPDNNHGGTSTEKGGPKDDKKQEGQEPEEEPLRFVLPGDDTGNGIDFWILNDGSWKTLQEYCEVRPLNTGWRYT